MNHHRNSYHHKNLRSALVDSAVRLIEQGGHVAFSLREAARDVGVSANAVYRHFDDKSGLLTAASADGFSRLSLEMEHAMDAASERHVGSSPEIVRFKAVGRAYVEFAIKHVELFRLIFGTCGSECLSSNAADTLNTGKETPWTLLGKSLDALVVAGVLSPKRRHGAELKAWTVVHGFAMLATSGHAYLWSQLLGFFLSSPRPYHVRDLRYWRILIRSGSTASPLRLSTISRSPMRLSAVQCLTDIESWGNR